MSVTGDDAAAASGVSSARHDAHSTSGAHGATSSSAFRKRGQSLRSVRHADTQVGSQEPEDVAGVVQSVAQSVLHGITWSQAQKPPPAGILSAGISSGR